MTGRALATGSVALALVLALTGARVARAGETEAERAKEGAFCQALDRTIEGKLPIEGVRLGVTDRGDGAWRSLQLYGDGVGVWKGAKQFKLKPKAVKKLLKMLERAHFCAWESEAGESDEPRLTRGISLVLGDLSKTTMEVEDEGESREAETRKTAERERDAAELKTLVSRLLDACEKDGEAGMAAATLQDGLDKLRDGTLAPEVLAVSLNAPARGGSGAGWLVQIRGREVTAVSQSPGVGQGEKWRGHLSDADFTNLVRELVASGVASLPLNVYSPAYADLSVSVMNQRRAIQARAFAGMTPETNRSAQQAFEKIRAALHSIYTRASAPVGSAK